MGVGAGSQAARPILQRSTPLRESTRERKATRMSARRPYRGYCRLRARGSGIWDRASRRVMPLLYPTSRISVRSGPGPRILAGLVG
jgi:hypothetical protein